MSTLKSPRLLRVEGLIFLLSGGMEVGPHRSVRTEGTYGRQRHRHPGETARAALPHMGSPVGGSHVREGVSAPSGETGENSRTRLVEQKDKPSTESFDS